MSYKQAIIKILINTLPCIFFLITGVFFVPISVSANSLNAPAPVDDAGSAMYTIEDIYHRLDSGMAGNKRTSSFIEPTRLPGESSYNLNDIMNVAPAADNTNGAMASEVLQGKTFWGLRSKDTWGTTSGSMPDIGAQTITPGTTYQTIKQGYHNGNGRVAGDPDLIPDNIKSGVSIFGVSGQYSCQTCPAAATGDATAAEVLSGKTFSNANRTGISGTMPNIGTQNITPGTSDQTISQGYHNGNGKVSGDANLTPGNIKSGVSIFGVNGSVTEATGDATSAEVLSGKTFSNANSAGISGTMPNIGAQNITPGTSDQTISQGYHNGSGKVAGDADLTAANIKSGVNIFGVSGQYACSACPPGATGNAVAADVLSGKTFSNSTTSGISGTMTNVGAQNITPGTTDQTISQGYHNGSGKVAGDADLVTGNIRAGISIFGVSGKTEVVDTTSGNAGATDIKKGKKAWAGGNEITGTANATPVSKTGQTGCWDSSGTSVGCTNTGQDGEFQKGVAHASPRFTDNADGTITDNSTGLIWLKNANCAGTSFIWADTFVQIDNLNNTGAMGTINCGDTSNAGTHQTDWRLPNRFELESLLDLQNTGTALPSGHPFTSVSANNYWSSTSYAGDTQGAWYVNLDDGSVGSDNKTASSYNIWPVRGDSL